MSAVQSSLCRYDHFSSDWYRRWEGLLIAPGDDSADIPRGNRKHWEWAAILDAVQSRGKLKPGMKGLGFAVGTEPLSSIFASYNVDVLASDLVDGSKAGDWAATSQHAASLDALHNPNILDRAKFEKHVSFRSVDMSDLSALPSDTYDFLWSSCAFEHIGVLSDGLDFVVSAMRLLKPGGIAVHTTEFNVASNDETITDQHMCIYRKRDIEELDYRLRRIRCGLEPMNMDAGFHRHDLDFDFPPYYQQGKATIKIEVWGHIATSCILIAHKGG
jgi:hypothetical protein